ncbi:hypothetical protein Tco_1420674 [Tanacetum coccineum]
MSSYNHFGCSWCGGPFNDGNYPSCSTVGAGNEFVHDPNPFPYDNTPDFYDQPPQPQYETYLCELCGNDSHFGYDCPPRFPLVYEQEPSYNKNYSDNYYPQNSLSFPQQYLCCENSGVLMKVFKCQLMNQNYFEPNPIYNSSYSGFDQPPQYSINHQEDLNQQEMNDVHDRWDKIDELQNELHQMLQSFCEKFLQQKQVASINQSPPHEMKDIECKDSYDSNLDESTFLVTPLSDSNEDEFFAPGDNIELLLHHDLSISVDSILYDVDAPIDDLITKDKIFDPGGDIDEIDAFLDVDISTILKMDCPDFKDSCARGFVHRPLDLQSFTCLYMGIRYPRSY